MVTTPGQAWVHRPPLALDAGLLSANDARDGLGTLLKPDPDIPAVSLHTALATLRDNEKQCPPAPLRPGGGGPACGHGSGPGGSSRGRCYAPANQGWQWVTSAFSSNSAARR